MTAHKTHAQKKESILAAARKVAREGGLRSANVRAIATEAGTSPASVLYYFNSIDQLVERAIEHIVSEYFVDRRELISTLSDPVAKIRRLIDLGIPDTVGDDMRLVYEVAANLPRYPQFAAPLREIHESQVAMYVDVIHEGERSGDFRPSPDAESVARNIVAIEDTYDFYPLIGIDRSRAGLRENLRSYARLALGNELSS